ncbi:hypothetical protein AUJ46_06335 [Candidatus Peregrinibacteria bacterium CG1_02_54_53]|nr:MAG: hypothetical protein AUJ46_06335 [Candidatus Peregrinibacteria bacterium CG1_02_54_53]
MATPTPPQPPRPGDPVPAGGLDPTQVFGSPPPPPPQQTQGQQTGGGQQDGTVPPTDQGPPPPPPGTKATKEMGFDDEDLKILGEVGDYRFGTITAKLTNENIPVPPHSETKFDDQHFLTLLCGSISLTRDEKWRIIMAIPKLSQFQIDELQKILEEERRKFSELSPKHLLQLMKLEQKHSDDWRDLQAVSVQQAARGQEEQQADEIRKQLGL